MKPILVLIGTFLLSVIISRIATGDIHLAFSGNLAMCMMLFLTATGHFLFPTGMTMMLPPIIPFKKMIIYLTGIFEIIAGVALLFPAARIVTGWLLLAFFILILPANIYAAYKHVNLEQATYEGPGLNYLWFRVPEQILFIGWVYYFSIHQ
ncbi:MAG: hypothetical protein J0I41_12010 [Filimonas sp.]|nr:hypothetical protein [Filimonas sp.]